jgi:hypothetical protein
MEGKPAVLFHEERGRLGDKSFRILVTEYAESRGSTFSTDVHVHGATGKLLCPVRVLDGAFDSLQAAKIEGLRVALAVVMDSTQH